MQTDAAGRKSFYKTLLVLAFPMVLQNLLDSAVGAADTVMLDYVSQSALSASSLANNVQFILYMFFYGVCSGSSVLFAQYWGKKDYDTIERTMGIALRFSLAIGAIFFLASFCAPERIMRIFTPEEVIIAQGAKYLRIVSFGYLTGAFVQVYCAAQRSMERVMFGTVVNTISLLLNVALNACFIFGLLFFPKLDLVGVAIATLIARLAACAICVADALRPRLVRLRLPYLFARKKELFQDFIRFTLPALGNDFAWGLGFSMYSVILGHLGSDMVAANSYAGVVRSLSTIVCFAIANAAAIIMGKTLGENRLADAAVYGRRFKWMSVITGAAAGAAIAVISPFVLGHTHLNEAALDFLRFMLAVSTVNVVGQSVNTMLICGVFRAGGDTRFGFVLDALVMWIYGVSLGSLCAFVLKIPPKWVYFVLFMDESVKIPFCFWRFRKRLWLRNITRDMH